MTIPSDDVHPPRHTRPWPRWSSLVVGVIHVDGLDRHHGLVFEDIEVRAIDVADGVRLRAPDDLAAALTGFLVTAPSAGRTTRG